jgi:hypothetical protein
MDCGAERHDSPRPVDLEPGTLASLPHWELPRIRRPCVVKKCDEYIRQRTLQAVALSAVVVAVLALIYYFLELLGWRRMGMAWVSNILWAVFVAQMVRLIASGKGRTPSRIYAPNAVGPKAISRSTFVSRVKP